MRADESLSPSRNTGREPHEEGDRDRPKVRAETGGDEDGNQPIAGTVETSGPHRD